MRRPSLPRPSMPKLRRAGGRRAPKLPGAAGGSASRLSGAAGGLASKLPPLKLLVPGVVAILVVVVLIGTCGGDDQKGVRDTLNRFAQATRDRDYQALCDDLLSSSLVDELRTADQPCEVAWRIGLSDVHNPTLEVRSVSIDGDKATAKVDTAAADQPPLRTSILLVREHGGWRISSLPAEQKPAAGP